MVSVTSQVFSLLAKRRYQLLLLTMLVVGLSLPFVFAGKQVWVALRSMVLTDVAALLLLMFALIALNTLRVMLLFPTRYEKLTPLALLRLYLAVDFFAKSTPAGVGAPLAAVRLIQPYQVPVNLYISILMITVMLDLICVAALTLMAVFIWGAGVLAGAGAGSGSFTQIVLLAVAVLLPLIMLLLLTWKASVADFLAQTVFLLTRSECLSAAVKKA